MQTQTTTEDVPRRMYLNRDPKSVRKRFSANCLTQAQLAFIKAHYAEEFGFEPSLSLILHKAIGDLSDKIEKAREEMDDE